MKNNASIVYSFFLVIGDFCSLLVAFVSAYILRVTFGERPIFAPVTARTYLAICLLIIPFFLVIFALVGLYNRTTLDKRFSELGRLFIGSFTGFLLVIAIAYFSNKAIFPAKLVPIYGFLFTFALLLVFRTIARVIRRMMFARGRGISNVLLVGDTPATYELLEWLGDPRKSGYKVIGVVGARDKTDSVKHFDTFDEAIKQLRKKRIHSIMQTEMYRDSIRNNDILTYAQTHHVAYRFIPGNSELFVGNIDVELFQASIPMIAVHQTALIGWGRIVKRLFDLFVSLVLLVVLSPLFIVVSILNKIFTGNVFFRQRRLTRFNQEFDVYKFQTLKNKYNGLTPEAGFEKMGKPELAKEFRDNGNFLEKDPRLTSFGRFIRKTSIDELPQLFNVIKGDLSLVGPRALVPKDLENYAKKHTILSVKSGLTGLAQVSGRNNISLDERRKLDMYYVQNWSFWMDIVILLKTLRVVFRGDK